MYVILLYFTKSFHHISVQKVMVYLISLVIFNNFVCYVLCLIWFLAVWRYHLRIRKMGNKHVICRGKQSSMQYAFAEPAELMNYVIFHHVCITCISYGYHMRTLHISHVPSVYGINTIWAYLEGFWHYNDFKDQFKTKSIGRRIRSNTILWM